MHLKTLCLCAVSVLLPFTFPFPFTFPTSGPSGPRVLPGLKITRNVRSPQGAPAASFVFWGRSMRESPLVQVVLSSHMPFGRPMSFPRAVPYPKGAF